MTLSGPLLPNARGCEMGRGVIDVRPSSDAANASSSPLSSSSLQEEEQEEEKEAGLTHPSDRTISTRILYASVPIPPPLIYLTAMGAAAEAGLDNPRAAPHPDPGHPAGGVGAAARGGQRRAGGAKGGVFARGGRADVGADGEVGAGSGSVLFMCLWRGGGSLWGGGWGGGEGVDEKA